MRSAAQRWLLVVLVSSLAVVVARLLPLGLRRMDEFHVRQVEVLGARYLDPQEAVAVSGIAPTSTVFDDFAPWREALLRHPLVLDVAITRRLPSTVVLQVTETRPLAFARLPELRPVDARGRVLDIDPARLPLDLPVLLTPPGAGSEGELRAPAARRALATLAAVAELEPALYQLASEVASLRDGIRLTVRDPAGAELLVPTVPDPVRLHLLRLALADVSGGPRTRPADAGARLRRIDARFRELIVVALNPNQSR